MTQVQVLTEVFVKQIDRMLMSMTDDDAHTLQQLVDLYDEQKSELTNIYDVCKDKDFIDVAVDGILDIMDEIRIDIQNIIRKYF